MGKSAKTIIQILMVVFTLFLLGYSFKKADDYTSTDAYCNSCHVHDHAHVSWKESVHYSNCNGEVVSCVSCHLPPKWQGYYGEKLKAGIRDIYAYYCKDSTTYDWKQKALPENAVQHTFEASCVSCHPKLFPANLSANGEQAHWHYTQHSNDLHCVNCHSKVGHGPTVKATHNVQISTKKADNDTIYSASTTIVDFKDFTETIPQSEVAFDMVAVAGGSATIGQPNKEVEVQLSSFFIGRHEVSWEEYLLFMRETESEGRAELPLDGISGATPPWGNPDQGWGMGQRPVITITHHAATIYCRWLSAKTGKTYRLPTEAEWEYTAQKAYSGIADQSTYVNGNNSLTLEPNDVQPDKLGLKHVFGNVKEFCVDSYTDIGYVSKGSIIENPIINTSSKDVVIKGGSFKASSSTFNTYDRESTQHDKWMKTDPQIPKSIWWYSDCNDVGFRLVLSYEQQNK